MLWVGDRAYPIGPADTSSVAAVNERGQAVGTAYAADGGRYAFVAGISGWQRLTAPDGGNTTATDINRAGIVVGAVLGGDGTSPGSRAIRWLAPVTAP